ncbi:MAG: rRNA maturation RNase YbeY [Saprospiraceae bacterium]
MAYQVEPLDQTTGIFLYTETVEPPCIDKEKIIFCLKKIVTDHGKILGCINTIFCSDDYLLNLNKEYLNHDYYTDILTFPMQAEPLAGDLFISVDRIREYTQKNNISFQKEIYRVVIHGVLHLVGYGDKTEEEKKEMRSKEDYFLKVLDEMS